MGLTLWRKICSQHLRSVSAQQIHLYALGLSGGSLLAVFYTGTTLIEQKISSKSSLLIILRTISVKKLGLAVKAERRWDYPIELFPGELLIRTCLRASSISHSFTSIGIGFLVSISSISGAGGRELTSGDENSFSYYALQIFSVFSFDFIIFSGFLGFHSGNFLFRLRFRRQYAAF